jgi:hypothetical protein
MYKGPRSRAIVKCIRLNPIHPEDEFVINYLQKMEKKGWEAKKVFVDAIAHRGGATPEMFAKGGLEDRLLAILEGFTQELRAQIGNGKIDLSSSQDVDGELSTFTKNFSKGLFQRQAMTLGDEDGEE